MQFNVVLANHRSAALQGLDDVLRPVFAGLRAAGHRVVVPARQFQKRPVVNLVVGDFSDAAFAQSIRRTRASWGDEFVIGAVYPRGPDGPETSPAPVDFAWTLAANLLPPGLLPADRVAVLGYGFEESLIGPRLIADAAARDLDVVVYGPEHPRVTALVRGLEAAKLGAFLLRPGTLPDYLVTDLLSRGKVVAVAGDGRLAPATLRPRIAKAICNGVLVIAEPGSADEALAGAVVECALDDMPARCQAIVAGGDAATRGLQALERFKRVPMQGALAAALAVAPLAGPRG